MRQVVPAAVVLDFDGVVANSEPLHLAALQQALADVGISLSAQDYYERYLGLDDASALEAVAVDRNIVLAPEETRRLFERKAGVLGALLASAHVLFPGAAERVREYAAVLPLAIASGARRGEIEPVLPAPRLRSCFTATGSPGVQQEMWDMLTGSRGGPGDPEYHKVPRSC